MEQLITVFDEKYREYRDYLYEKSWADAALAQSYLLGVTRCMWAVWDKDAGNAHEIFEEIVSRHHLIEE